MSKKTITKPERLEEYALMQRIASGDENAFERFFDKYFPLIYSTVFKVLNHREDTEDVSNDVLTTMWRKAADYHPEKGSLVTWICTTARNRAIDSLRSHQRRTALYDRYEQRVEMEYTRRRNEESGTPDREDARQFLQTAVVDLSKEQKELIELAYFEGLTQREIAKRTDTPLGTVKARIRRGVERLRTSVNGDLKEEGKLLLSTLSNS